MATMVIGSIKKLDLGILTPGTKGFRGIVLNGSNNTYPAQPVFIIREATHDEWVKDCINLFGICNNPDDVAPYYYEVSTD